jgi:hypothetical protein
VNKLLRFLIFCVASTLTVYCGRFLFRSLSLIHFDDPGQVGFLMAGIVWSFRLLSAAGAVFSATVAGACLME